MRIDSQGNGTYLGRHQVLEKLLNGEYGGWHRASKNKGFEIEAWEVKRAWVVLEPGRFIDVSKLVGSTLLWEQVEELQPRQQPPADGRGLIPFRSNNRQARKMRSAGSSSASQRLSVGQRLAPCRKQSLTTDRTLEAQAEERRLAHGGLVGWAVDARRVGGGKRNS